MRLLDDVSLERLLGDPWFAGRDPERRRMFLDHCHLKPVRRGERAYRLGDEPDGLYAVLDGEIRLVTYPEPGRQLVHLVVRPGRWFGQLSILDGGPRPHDAVAAADSRLLRIGMREIDLMIREDPQIYRDLTLLACLHQRASLKSISRAIGKPLRSRVANLLADLAHREPGATLAVTQEDIAERVGASRQSLSKILKAFEARGLIVLGYRNIRVLAREELRAI